MAIIETVEGWTVEENDPIVIDDNEVTITQVIEDGPEDLEPGMIRFHFWNSTLDIPGQKDVDPYDTFGIWGE